MDRRKKEYKEKFEQFIKDVMAEYEAVGLAITVVDKDDILYENYFGYRDGEKKLPIDEHTIFGMASVSKSFTAMSIMQLYERGIIDIYKPVREYIPEFKDPEGETVLVWHFLNHSGGYFPLRRITVPEVAKDMGIWDDGKSELTFNAELMDEGRRRIAESLNNGQRLGKPGERVSYCNDGYGLLSEIVRLYGGEPSFADYVKKNIFEPLGMTRSYCEYVKPLTDPNAVKLYKKDADGKMQTGSNYYENAVVLPGGGIVKSNIADMRSYVRAYMRGGSPLLGNYYYREMIKPRNEYRYQAWYGFAIASKYISELSIFEHGGSMTGISSNFAWTPQLGIGVVITCNTSGVPVARISDAAFRWFNGEDPIAKDRWHDVGWDEQQMKDVCGTYHSGEGGHIVIRMEDGKLNLNVTGQDMKFRTVAPDLIAVPSPYTEADMMFIRDVQGMPAGKVGAVRFGGRIIPRVED